MGLALALVTAGPVAACQIISGLTEPAPKEDASVALPESAPPDTGPPQLEPCDPVPAPVSDPLIGFASGDMVLSYASIDISKSPPEYNARLCSPAADNLDGVDTVCTDKVPATRCIYDDTAADPPCDGPGGSDNAVARLIASVANISLLGNAGKSFTSQFEPARVIRAGLSNVVVRVSGYNDQPNDGDVTVSIALSAGLTATLPTGPTSGPPDVESAPVVWDGESKETWSFEQSSVNQRNEPSVKSRSAYVANGIVVAQLDVAPLPFGGDGLNLSQATMVGRLEKTPTGYRINRGRFVGSIPARDIIQMLGTINGGPIEELCREESKDLLNLAIGIVCGSVDYQPDAGPVCDHLSIGVSFFAVPAVIDANPAPSRFKIAPPCDGGWVAPECPFIVKYRQGQDAGPG